MRNLAACLAILLFAADLYAAEPDVTLHISADKPGAAINPQMWGIFFEDINFGADGGLYAELVKNRSFEFTDPRMGWSRIGDKAALEIRDDEPFSKAQPHYVRVSTPEGGQPARIANEGFRGIGVLQGHDYHFSVAARRRDKSSKLEIELIGSDGTRIGSATVVPDSPDWKTYRAPLTSSQTDAKATLRLAVEGAGTLDLDMISLCPADTWKGRENGLRADLVQMLADLQPGFMRFPGGCIVEGRTLENRYQWKNTIGPVAERMVIPNRWNTEIRNRQAPDYCQSNGLGFYEYFLLCEDIGAAPLPILNCGMACQFNSNELCPLDQLGPYIQDAIDLIEFANGPTTSTWGAKRAAMGHPEPFKMTMLGIGNEQWGQQYVERYAKFSQVLGEKHPEIHLIGGAGASPEGQGFASLWRSMTSLKADFVDEHYYKPPDWFFTNTSRYDKYDRSRPPVFAGEYAAHVNNRANSLLTALAEGAMMTGFERNADIVRMASYAPLFGHIDAWQWRPNLIWFDNLRTMPTPNYYVQQMFATNRGSVILPLEIKQPKAEGPPRFFASSVRDDATGDVIVKVVNAGNGPVTATLVLDGLKDAAHAITQTVLTAARLAEENSLDNPHRIKPVSSHATAPSNHFPHEFPPQSCCVLRIAP